MFLFGHKIMGFRQLHLVVKKTHSFQRKATNIHSYLLAANHKMTVESVHAIHRPNRSTCTVAENRWLPHKSDLQLLAKQVQVGTHEQCTVLLPVATISFNDIFCLDTICTGDEVHCTLFKYKSLIIV